MDLFETEWDIAFRTGQENERERIIKLLENKAGNITVEELHNRFGLFAAIRLIRGVQPHPPQQFRDTANGE